jgi:mannose/fructose-specific phosphotransferase system component IIA
MISCLLLSHGKIAEALLETSRRIVGECENIYALNCSSLTPEAVYEKIVYLIESENLYDGLFIVVCLKGGSCWNAGARIAKNYQKVALISGLSLPMVLSFITKRAKFPFEELAQILIEDGKRGIARLNG